jgi:hypothetical protein
MKIKTLEKYIKYTTIPYGDLLKRAERGGLKTKEHGEGVVEVYDENNRQMVLFFESEATYKENRTSGLIKTQYNY